MKNIKLPLTEKEQQYLKLLLKTRTIQAQIVDRAKILLYKADGLTFKAIAEKLDISPTTVQLCISKYKEGTEKVSEFFIIDKKFHKKSKEVSCKEISLDFSMYSLMLNLLLYYFFSNSFMILFKFTAKIVVAPCNSIATRPDDDATS